MGYYEQMAGNGGCGGGPAGEQPPNCSPGKGEEPGKAKLAEKHLHDDGMSSG